MPKKFTGENSKAVAARARKAAVKDAEAARKQREVEETSWKENDKHILKKQQRKDDQERKKQLALEKKAETKALIEKELEGLKKSNKNAPPPKITRAQIEGTKLINEKKEKEKQKIETHVTVPLEENINRIIVDGEEARSVTEAICILSMKEEAEDRHPGKRLKAAYAAYEEKRLSQLKLENPTLRLSQLLQMIFKEWQKSPENPLNKAEDIKSQAEAYHSGLVETFQTPCDVVEKSDIIFCCVSDPAAVKDIVYGKYGVLNKRDSLDGKGYVEMTTIDNETSIDICNLITAKGGRYLEAQLQGSKQEADEGNLIVLGAGDKTLFDDCHTCFRAIGKTAFYLGDVGFATKMNLVLQVVKGVSLAGLAEAFALADRSGLSPKDVLEVFNLTSITNPYLKKKAELIVAATFQHVEQPLQHMQKDIKLALHLADTLKQPLAMASTANEVYKHTRRFGCDAHDAASVYMRTRY